jgi:hypothetical protein
MFLTSANVHRKDGTRGKWGTWASGMGTGSPSLWDVLRPMRMSTSSSSMSLSSLEDSPVEMREVVL